MVINLCLCLKLNHTAKIRMFFKTNTPQKEFALKNRHLFFGWKIQGDLYRAVRGMNGFPQHIGITRSDD